MTDDEQQINALDRLDAYKDRVTTRLETHLAWRDRLRILVHGRIDHTVELYTENEVGLADSTCQPRVQRVRDLVRQRINDLLGKTYYPYHEVAVEAAAKK